MIDLAIVEDDRALIKTPLDMATPGSPQLLE
jgi:hypothetical protein